MEYTNLLNKLLRKSVVVTLPDKFRVLLEDISELFYLIYKLTNDFLDVLSHLKPKIQKLPLLMAEQRQFIIHTWNDEKRGSGDYSCILTSVSARAFFDPNSEPRLVSFPVCNSLNWITYFRSQDLYDLKVFSISVVKETPGVSNVKSYMHTKETAYIGS